MNDNSSTANYNYKIGQNYKITLKTKDMKIFTQEFKTFVISNLLCRWIGHKSSGWKNTMWAPGYFGLPTKFCKNCWKVLKTKEITQKNIVRMFNPNSLI